MPEATRSRRSSAQVEAAILTATLELVGETGYAALTVDAVAQRADAARTVLYRRWPDKPHLVAAALAHARAHLVPAERSGDLRTDLRTVLRNVADLLAGPLGAACAVLHAERAAKPEVRAAAEQTGLGLRRLAIATVLQEAVERGELDAAVLESEATSAGTALLLFHLFDDDRAVDHALADAILDDVVWPAVARFAR
ncbi:MAG: transcriptional regulator, TetR family [Solirubrobacterales bacterium]|nr:transcriptional regulator, TetR family [Solirubrobacterales bacterium]